MKRMKKLMLLTAILLLSSCESFANGKTSDWMYSFDNSKNFTNEYYDDDNGSSDKYDKIEELDYQSPKDSPTSTFSLDSSSGAYANIRSTINHGGEVEPDQVIIEQMINYFDYPDYEAKDDAPVTLFTETSDCPWNSEAVLASIAVKTKKVEQTEVSSSNYVLLVDVSGSMSSSNKLPYVKKGFSYLAEGLKEEDTLSIVTYSGKEAVVLDGAKGNEKTKIIAALDNLTAGGSTNGEKGIKLAYQLAEKHYIRNGNNQILLATDGDFNVGVTSTSDLEKMVLSKKESGIFFSCFGFGMGNYHSTTMQALALNGNGNVYYLDSESELERLFTGDLSSILQVVSKDSKIQVTFDSEKVSKYRLIGYERRMLTKDDFANEDKDAGEIYSNKTVMALYEIYPSGEDKDALISLDFKYKDPYTNESSEIKKAGAHYSSDPTSSYCFASAVAEFGLFLRASKYKGTSSLAGVKSLYDEKKSVYDLDPLKKEFRVLVETYEKMLNKSLE